MSECLCTGTPLKNYVIESVLGRGAFGITYLARDNDLEHLVAIKEYLPQDFATREKDNTVIPLPGEKGEFFEYGLNSFLNEAKTIVKFRHPNIVRVIAFFRENSTAYIVMEYEKGRTLKQYKRAQDGLTESALLNIVCPIINGLAGVHEHGYIHRDIKPDNIVIRDDDSPVLIDFGTARDTGNSNSAELTQIFTNGYAPYEQCNPAWKNQGPWTDIYSLGVTMYYLLTGEKVESAQHRAVSDNHQPLTQADYPDFSPELLNAINASIEFHPADRPQSLKEWFKAICLARESMDSAQDDLTVIQKAPQHSFHPHRVCEAHDEYIGQQTLIQHMFGRLGTEDVQSFAVIGFAKSGKTSLLKHLQCKETLDQYLPSETIADYQFIYIDVFKDEVTSEEGFFELLYQKAGELFAVDKDEHFALEHISEIVEARDQRLVVMLDNFDLIITNLDFTVHFYERLRSWFSTHPAIGCIVTSPIQLLHLAVPMELAGSPFFNIFGAYNLRALSDAETHEFLVDRLPVPISESKVELEKMIKDVGNHPYELHVVGEKWITEYELSGNSDYENIRNDCYQALRPYYESLYQSFNRKQKNILNALTEKKPKKNQRYDPELVDKAWVTKDGSSLEALFLSRYIKDCKKKKLDRNTRRFEWIKRYLGQFKLGKARS